MTTATPPTTKTATGSERTRRQLQELDALLQQMLALPVGNPPSPGQPETQTTEIAPTQPAAADPNRTLVQESARVCVDSFTATLDQATSSPPIRPAASPAATLVAPTPKKLEGIGQMTSLRRTPLSPCRPDIKTPLPLSAVPIMNPAPKQVPAPVTTSATVMARTEPAMQPLMPQPGAQATGLGAQRPVACAAGLVSQPTDTLARVEPKEKLPTPSQFDLAGPEMYDVSPSNSADHLGSGTFLDSAPELIGRTRQQVAMRYRWLVGVNSAYDRTASFLGPLGHFLTLPFVKNMLGLAGLVMLGLAIWLSGWLEYWLG